MTHRASMLRHISINASLYLAFAGLSVLESPGKPTSSPGGDIAFQPKPSIEWVNPDDDSQFPQHKVTPQDRGSGR